MTPERESFVLGEPFAAQIEYENRGATSVLLSESIQQPCRFQSSVTVRDVTADRPGAKSCHRAQAMNCVGWSRTLEPGEKARERIPLHAVAHVRSTGEYEVTVAYTRAVILPGRLPEERTFSGSFRVSVTPPDAAHLEEVQRRVEKQLDSDNSVLEHHALDDLAFNATVHTESLLLRLIQDEKPIRVEHAIRGLRRVNSGRGREAIALVAVSDKPAGLRRTAIDVLGDMEDRGYLDVVSRALGDDAQEVRIAALYSTARLGGDDAIPLLQRYLLHDDVNLRRHTARALRHTASRAAVPLLLDALGDGEADVRQEAGAALNGLLGRSMLEVGEAEMPPAPELKRRWQQWWNENAESAELHPPPSILCSVG